ncbi:MAG: ribosome biogenesis GTPase Der [Phycisphaerales bacterium]
MSFPRIAIVGRPNVGKSSLLNMLAKRKVSIVDDVPGVTRDRVTTVVELEGPLKTEPIKRVEVIDTGGYGVYVTEGGRFDDAGEDLTRLTDDIEAQIAAGVDLADLILFVVDSQAGLTAIDESIATMLRERSLGGKGRDRVPVVVVANKVDADNWEPFGFEAAALGFGEPWLVSAKTNFRRRDFVERLFALLPYEVERAGESRERMPEMQLALVGKRNAGKSTFVNALAGETRAIVSEIAGTTRDAIDVRFEMDGRALLAIDTAGVRKKNRFADRVEYWAFDRCQRAIERADVALLLLDATQKISAVDKRLGMYLTERFKPTVIVVTKWDLAEGRPNRKGQPVSIDDYREYFNREMPGLAYAPIVFTAAGDGGRGVREAVEVAFDLFGQAHQRVSTGRLNEFFRDILARRGPSSSLGTKAKILFVTQVTVNPPTIVLVVNKPKLFDERYMRYLMNRIREELPFEEIPVRLLVRERRRAELGDLLSGEHRRQQSATRSIEEGEALLDRQGEEIDPDLEIDEMDVPFDLDEFFSGADDDDDDDDDEGALTPDGWGEDDDDDELAGARVGSSRGGEGGARGGKQGGRKASKKKAGKKKVGKKTGGARAGKKAGGGKGAGRSGSGSGSGGRSGAKGGGGGAVKKQKKSKKATPGGRSGAARSGGAGGSGRTTKKKASGGGGSRGRGRRS